MSSFREKSKTETNSHLLCVPLDWTALYFSQFVVIIPLSFLSLSFKILWNDTNFEISKFHKKKVYTPFPSSNSKQFFPQICFLFFFFKIHRTMQILSFLRKFLIAKIFPQISNG